MVVISIKQSDGDGFLFQTTTDTPNHALISSLVGIYNGRLQARAVAESARGLALHGPMKNPQQSESNTQGIYDADQDDISSSTYSPDPSGIRSGNAPEPKLVGTLLQTVQDLEDYIDKSQVQNRIALEQSILDEKLANVQGAVKMAYPMGLPHWDNLKLNLESTDNIKGILQSSSTSLWMAGKEFPKGKLVSDRLGKNEKQKVIAKLQPSSEGPPSREPVVSEDERKAMMAHYFKRQEELKKLSDADDDEYLNSSWADPKQMKRGLQGIGDVRAPGLRF